MHLRPRRQEDREPTMLKIVYFIFLGQLHFLHQSGIARLAFSFQIFQMSASVRHHFYQPSAGMILVQEQFLLVLVVVLRLALLVVHLIHLLLVTHILEQ